VGSLLVMLVTALVAVPLGIAGGIYLEEYARKNWVTDVIEINITNLAGVPSIVYGLLALGLFVYTFGFGQSILSAGLTLALLILPIVIVATREALRAIPQHIREAAYACGATQVAGGAATTCCPTAMPGILTGVIIGLARAIGETAPIITIGALTFIAFLPPSPVTGDRRPASFDWLFSPFTVMPIQIFNWTSRPDPAFQAERGRRRPGAGGDDAGHERAWPSGCATACARTSSGETPQRKPPHAAATLTLPENGRPRP
jgi:phosphate transport system permease protein